MITLAWIKERIKIDTVTGCWIYQGTRNRNGYGVTGEYLGGGKAHQRKRTVLIHKRVWELTREEIADDLCLLHTCPGGDNPACCNPDHLRLGTRGENNTDRKNKGRSATGDRHGFHLHPEAICRGERKPGVKLTEELVRQIKIRSQERTQHQLAAEYGVSRSSIQKILDGTKWKHVTENINDGN